MTYRSFTKAAVIVLAVAILAPVAPIAVPRAHAIPVEETFSLPQLTATVLKRAAITAGKVAIQSMTRSIVNWINSGFNGSPAFERNLGVNLQRLADAAAADFVTRLATNSTVNSPWIDRIAGTVARGYLLYTSRDRLAARLEYTLSGYVRDAAAWNRGDFGQGGLNAWMSATFRCGNDPYCAEFAAQEELINLIDASLRQRVEELGWGRGFLSWRCDCEESAGTPSLSNPDESGSCNICTPGSTIESAIGITATSPLRQLEVAESIDQIIGALASQMISQVFSGGGLFTGGSSGTDTSRDQLAGTSLLATLSASFVETAQNDRTNVTAYRDSWTRIRDAATAAAARCAAGTPGAIEAAGLVAQGNAAIAKAGRTLDALVSIITRAEAARAGSTSTLAAAVTADYNCLVSGGFPDAGACSRSNASTIGTVCPVSSFSLPGGSELACTLAQGQDAEGTSPPTLLMRMNDRADGSCD